MTDHRARLQAIAAAILFSTGGVALKAPAFSAVQTSCLRSGIAAVVLVLWMRGRVSRPTAGLGIAVLYAATLSLFVAATRLTTAANAIFLQSAAPIFIVLLGPALLDERPRRADLVYLAAVGAGLALCLLGRSEPTGTAPDPATGNALALICSLTWALTLVGLRRVERGRDHGVGLSSVVAGNVVAFGMALPFAWPFPAAAPVDWAIAGYLGIVQVALAYVCLVGAVRRLPAFEVSLLLLIEPVLNPVWAWWLRGENPGAMVVAGGAAIIAASALRAVVASREERILTPTPPAI